MKFAEFLRTLILKRICERLLLPGPQPLQTDVKHGHDFLLCIKTTQRTAIKLQYYSVFGNSARSHNQQIGECKNGGNKKTKAHQIIKKTNISYSLTRTGSGKWYINKDRIVIKINLKIFL